MASTKGGEYLRWRVLKVASTVRMLKNVLSANDL